MKNKIIQSITALAIVLAGCSDTPVEKPAVDPIEAVEDLFPSLSPKAILSKLFDHPRMDGDIAVWKPDFEEQSKLPVSYDGKCHTVVDTVLYFTDHRERNCAAVILATYYLDEAHHDILNGDVGGSHFSGVHLGIALFSSLDEGWKLYEFKKQFTELGYFGTYRTGRQDAGQISLKNIGDRWTCLSLVQGIGGSTGVFWGYEQLFSIEEYHFDNQEKDEPYADEMSEWPAESIVSNLLTYNYYGSICMPEEECSVKTAELKIIPKKHDYYDIEMRIDKNGKIGAERYIYNERLQKYIRK